jgi:hypothetical protein
VPASAPPRCSSGTPTVTRPGVDASSSRLATMGLCHKYSSLHRQCLAYVEHQAPSVCVVPCIASSRTRSTTGRRVTTASTGASASRSTALHYVSSPSPSLERLRQLRHRCPRLTTATTTTSSSMRRRPPHRVRSPAQRLRPHPGLTFLASPPLGCVPAATDGHGSKLSTRDHLISRTTSRHQPLPASQA